jgi:hypothetical protein
VAPGDQPHRFVIHDRDRAFSQAVDAMLTSTGLRVLKTPVRIADREDASAAGLEVRINEDAAILDSALPLDARTFPLRKETQSGR